MKQTNGRFEALSTGSKDVCSEPFFVPSIELTPSQKTILTTFINLYRGSEDAVKGEDIVAEVNRNPGATRNQAQSLKALQLVEGVPGPKSGYKPTMNAYETLDMDKMDEPAFVPLSYNDEEVEGVNVDEIDPLNVHHPELCCAEIHVQGSVREFHEGDKICVGPTFLSKFVINGTLDGKDDMSNTLILRIDDI